MKEQKNRLRNPVKKFLLEVPEEIWKKWKDKIPRSISINNALINILKNEAEK
jgi:hypothetical protein